MAIIQLVLASVILGVIYIRMIKREQPSPIPVVQAVLPVAGGMASVPVSFMMFLGLSSLFMSIGISLKGLPPVPKSIAQAFFAAGLPEEAAKLCVMLIVMLIFRRKFRNVYEYILAGAAVGTGFTMLEEFFYGSGGLASLLRLATIAAHMLFGIIMAECLGIAAYKRASKNGSGIPECALAVIVPIVIHTLYDSFTANNNLLDSGNDAETAFGMVLAAVGTLLLFALQIIVLVRLKKNTDRYCDMKLNG